MGTTPDPNVMRAPALANSFANRMQQAANADNNAALVLERDRRAPYLAGEQRRIINQVDQDYERDPMSLGKQKTEDILARESLRQEGANNRAAMRRYGINGSTTRVAADLMSYATSKGLQPYQAAALVAHMQSESGFNTKVVGDNGTAFYGYQFRHDRKSGIDNFAKTNGLDVYDPKTSIDYLIKEMQTSEANTGGNAFFNAKTPEEASVALSKVIRHSTTGKHANETSNRVGLTSQFYNAFGGGKIPGARTEQPNAFGVTEGVDETGKKYRSMYLSSYQAQALQGDLRYKVEIDPFGKQNSKGLLPYKIFENTPIGKTNGPAVKTNEVPKKEPLAPAKVDEDDDPNDEDDEEE